MLNFRKFPRARSVRQTLTRAAEYTKRPALYRFIYRLKPWDNRQIARFDRAICELSGCSKAGITHAYLFQSSISSSIIIKS